MSNNGKGPIPFAVRDNVPLVGRPIKPLTWFPTLSVICNCEGQQPLLLVGFGNISRCPSCRNGVRMFGAAQADIRRNPIAPHFDLDIIPASVLDGLADGAEEESERKPS